MRRIKILLILTLTFAACSEGGNPVSNNDNPTPPYINSEHVALGVPVDSDTTDDYIIIRGQYILSYNNSRGVPNWVAWNQDAEWYGDVERYSGKFKEDPLLPGGFLKIEHDDYTHSGYDRGHMVRSEDRTKTEEDNKSTFYMTNVLPQLPDLNRGAWLDLEYHYEGLCKEENKELYIIAGGIYHSNRFINGRVAIPDSVFKIIVVLDRYEGLDDVREDAEVISVCMPNIEGIRSEDWEKYITSVDRIEASTGYDFLNSVPVNVQKVIESRIIQ